MFFIPRYGIDGAALATLIAITLYSLAKLMFVVFRMKLYPFTRRTIYSFAVSLLTFFLFYYWEFPFHPLSNIILKAILMSIFYAFINYNLKLSRELNEVMDKVIGRFRP
jgi:O-antigen/teichoic acid export membrane protein